MQIQNGQSLRVRPRGRSPLVMCNLRLCFKSWLIKRSNGKRVHHNGPQIPDLDEQLLGSVGDRICKKPHSEPLRSIPGPPKNAASPHCGQPLRHQFSFAEQAAQLTRHIQSRRVPKVMVTREGSGRRPVVPSVNQYSFETKEARGGK